MSHNNVNCPFPHDGRKNICPKCKEQYAKSLRRRVGRYYWKKYVVVAYDCPVCGIVTAGAP
jgi:RNase P subunit RPR2